MEVVGVGGVLNVDVEAMEGGVALIDTYLMLAQRGQSVKHVNSASATVSIE